MSVTTFDPGWSDGAWRFRIPDVVGQIAIAVAGAGLATYAAIYVAFELTMIAPALFAADNNAVCQGDCGRYVLLRLFSNAGAMIVSVMPNIVWSCWRRRFSLQRALLAPPIIGLAALLLTSLAFLPIGDMLWDMGRFAPTIAAGCAAVALAMYIWHRLWMHLARRYAQS